MALDKFIIEILLIAFIFSLETVFPFFKPKQSKLQHDMRNLSMAVINAVLFSLFLAGMVVAFMYWVEAWRFGLDYYLNLGMLPNFLVIFILFDLWMYCWHRINHNIAFLWRFHRVHHSDLFLDVSSGLRFHPGEIILSSVFRLPIYGLLGMHVYHVFFYELALQIVVLFHHSNVKVPSFLERVLGWVIVTPKIHRVHHSDEIHETNSNYGSVFSFWDRLFGSFCSREDTHNISYGLKEFRNLEDQQLSGMLKTPFN